MKDRSESTSRRRVLAGVGSAGVAAAAATVVVRSADGTSPDGSGSAPARADTASGYRLTDHVKRYYGTTRI